jgi:putative ABC transport system substrate-binding protein
LLAKRFELLREIVPGVYDVALLVNPKGTLAERQIGDAKTATEKLGLHLHIVSVSVESDIEPAFDTMKQMKIGAFVVSTDPFLGFIGNDRLVALAARYRIPAIYNTREAPDAGGLIGYGPNKSDTWRQAALYVGRILKGEKPSDLPVLQPTSFETVINSGRQGSWASPSPRQC